MNGTFSALSAQSGQAVAYMKAEIEAICKKLPKRAPGSDGERRAAAYMAELLEKDCGCQKPLVENFEEHPSAFYNYFRLSSVLDIATVVSAFVHPALSVLFACASLTLFAVQFVLYRQMIDRFFPKKESVNVTAVRPCSGGLRQRVFLNGHIDAAWEFPLNYRFGGVVFEIPGVMALLGVVFCFVCGIAALVFGRGAWYGTAAWWGLMFVPFLVLLAFTYDPKHVVDGANDNLSGCFMGISLLREMERLGFSPEHTEVGVLLTGSEEAGLRGAKAWCAAHKDDYRDVPTYILSFDTIHDPKYLMVNEKDLNGTVKADGALTELFLAGAADAGVPCRRGMVPLFGGSTDSAAFTQGGFRSLGVTGLNHVLEDYYHTRRDSWDNLDDAGLENCWRATVCAIARMDAGTDGKTAG